MLVTVLLLRTPPACMPHGDRESLCERAGGVMKMSPPPPPCRHAVTKFLHVSCFCFSCFPFQSPVPLQREAGDLCLCSLPLHATMEQIEGYVCVVCGERVDDH